MHILEGDRAPQGMAISGLSGMDVCCHVVPAIVGAALHFLPVFGVVGEVRTGAQGHAYDVSGVGQVHGCSGVMGDLRRLCCCHDRCGDVSPASQVCSVLGWARL